MKSIVRMAATHADQNPGRIDLMSKISELRKWAVPVVLLLVALIYIPTLFGPHLMDDTDAVNGQIPRNILRDGDWVTMHLDGVRYMEKPPLMYWMIAVAYALLGEADWIGRIPNVLSILAIAWLIGRMGKWAFGAEAGAYAALMYGTCIGMFLFTRILIADAMVSGLVAFTLWAFLRALDEEEQRPALWAHAMAVAMGVGILAKGLIGPIFPVVGGALYLLITGEWRERRTWERLRPVSSILLMLAVSLPWVVLATVRNPPYFDFTLSSGPGIYRGFFWFFFFNEHLLRFLNTRWPRDYDTVPRHLFWLLHLVWFFPWSAYLPQALRGGWRGTDRASRMRLLCYCWAGFVLFFFTFSTTQEYYSMPAYPAFAVLIGAAMAGGSAWVQRGARVVAAVSAVALVAIAAILAYVWNLPTPGDISTALTQDPSRYQLSLGHMGDLTLESFAYLRPPLLVAGLAFLVGTAAAGRWRGWVTQLGLAAMMVLFLNAARMAMITFDPYLSSQPLAAAINAGPPGRVILGDQYFTLSSVFYYSNLQDALLLNGRYQNLEYGSYGPDSPDVFLPDTHLAELWRGSERLYLVLEGQKVLGLEKLVGKESLHLVKASGGKYLFTNQPL